MHDVNVFNTEYNNSIAIQTKIVFKIIKIYLNTYLKGTSNTILQVRSIQHLINAYFLS